MRKNARSSAPSSSVTIRASNLLVEKKPSVSIRRFAAHILGQSERLFEDLNDGKPFAAKYDRRHDFSLVLSHKFNEKWDIGATWVYGTGNALTFPQGVYLGMMQEFEDKVTAELVESYGSRNSTRLPSYHRLDFAINKHRKKENWEIVKLKVFKIVKF